MNREWILNQLRLIWCKIKNLEAGGTGGGIKSVQPGTNVTVDNTDPLNPIVSATGGGTAGESLTEEFTVTAGAGAFQNGETFPGGMTLSQAFIALLTDTFYPTFINPSFSFTNNAGVREVGESINLVLTGTFDRGLIKGANVSGSWNPNANQNPRAGLPTQYVIDGTTYTTTNLTQVKTVPNYVVPLSSTSFSGSVSYGTGVQPKDSEGTDYDTPLPAGTLSGSTSVVGYLRRFAGSTDGQPVDGTEIRTKLLGTSVLNTPNSFTFTTGTLNKVFVIAVPSNKTLVNVVNAGTNENLTSGFILSSSITNIPDAAGVDRPYKVYIMENAVPFSNDYTINVTIS